MRRHELSDPEGVRWVPDVPRGTGVLVLAGSSGRVDVRRAGLFAGLGCVSESIRWFGGPGQHGGPWEIPLETFFDRIDALRTDCDRILVVGTSFGSEAALLCGAESDAVDGVVAFAPSDVVWAGFDADGDEKSHWTHHGAPVPYLPFDFTGFIREDPARFRPLYEHSHRAALAATRAAAIPVERIGELVLVAGGDDQVWPSAAQAGRIVQRRADARRPTVLIEDADAGHRAILPGEEVVRGGMHMLRGGTERADRRLGAAAWEAIRVLIADGSRPVSP